MTEFRKVWLIAGVVLLVAGIWFPASRTFAAEGAGGVVPASETSGQLARGAKAWSENCGQCHNYREPQELRDDQWHVVVAHMRVRANLTGEQARDILAFLSSSN